MLYSFTGGADGGLAAAGLIFDAAGNLYGATVYGGAYGNCDAGFDGCGVVFKLAPNPTGTWTEGVIYSFGSTRADGAHPGAGLVFDTAGDLYGTTETGDASDGGTVFKLKHNPDGTWTESVLHSFPADSQDGVNLYGGLVYDAAGNVYGTTGGGGAYGYGLVFKLEPQPDGTWTESVLYSFTGGADGRGPVAGVIFDAAGNLYGTTYFGGADGYGAVFKLTPTSSGWKETAVHSFIGFGRYPVAPVIFDPAGNLYGTTGQGNGNGGLVFEITR